MIRIFNESLEEFIQSLEKPAIAKILRTIDLLEKFGKNLSEPHAKKIADSLFELRVRGKQEIRIFYTFCDRDIVLLHGFLKKSQRTPLKELKTALTRKKSLTET